MRIVYMAVFACVTAAILVLLFNPGGCTAPEKITSKKPGSQPLIQPGEPEQKTSKNDDGRKDAEEKSKDLIRLVPAPDGRGYINADDIEAERKRLKNMSLQELFKYIQTREFLDAKMVEAELKRRGLNQELFEFLLEKIQKGNLDDIACALSWLKRIAEQIKHEWALKLWEAMSKLFERSERLVKVFGEQGFIRDVSAILTKSQLDKSAYPDIAKRIVEMGKVDRSLFVIASQYWGAAAIKPLLDMEAWAKKQGEEQKDKLLRSLYYGFSEMDDHDAADELGKLLKARPDIAEWVMEGFLRSGGKPERELAFGWLKQEVPNPSMRPKTEEQRAQRKRINSTIIAGCLAAPHLGDDQEVIDQVKRIYLATDYRHTLIRREALTALIELLPATGDFVAELLSDPKKATGVLNKLWDKARKEAQWDTAVADKFKESTVLMDTLETAVFNQQLRIEDRQTAAEVLYYVTKEQKWSDEVKRLMEEERR